MPDLHVYKLDPDWFVAESPEDALACAAEYYGSMRVEPYDSEPVLEPDEKMMTINFEDEQPSRQTRSCAELAKSDGRGLLCSTEW